MIYLGFGYNRRNVERLRTADLHDLDVKTGNERTYFASRFHLPRVDFEPVKERLGHKHPFAEDHENGRQLLERYVMLT